MQAAVPFFKRESSGSLVLLVMAALAMLAANSPLLPYYESLHSHNSEIIINEGLMALFFLCIGIEIKKEMKEGHLTTRSQIALPLVAAMGGMLVPAFIYSFFNWNTPAMRGWAIPTATDIAFSLGVLGIFGKRIPVALRIFLMSIAVFDDVMAIIVIAVFYTKAINVQALAFALGCVLLLLHYNKKVTFTPPYLFAAAALWLALFDAGISPTIAGVILGLLMPLTSGKRVLHFLHGWVTFFVVPLFVFANAGVAFNVVNIDTLTQPVTLGIITGLFFGKQIGILMTTFIMVRLGAAPMPSQTNWLQMYGVSLLCGIGFTISLFIGTLAFGGSELMPHIRLGVFTGSLASALLGTICIAFALKPKKDAV